MHELAPDAAIREVLIPSPYVASLGRVSAAVVAALRLGLTQGGVVSLSAGTGEQCFTPAEVARVNSVLQAAQREHVTMIVSTGDSGAATTASWKSRTRTRARYTPITAGVEGLRPVRIDPPSLVMLDVCLPGISGFEICRELREQCGAELPIILVSGTRVDALDRSAGLLIGCDDFLVKPVDPNELLARVRRLLGRSAPRRTRAASREYGLTRRELAVLQQLASGLRQAEIAAELVISPKTVATHVQHILTKLGVHSGAQAVAFAHDNDLLAMTTPPAHRSL